MAELGAHFVPFSAQTRMSGVDVDGASIRKGAVDAILAYTRQKGQTALVPPQLNEVVERISRSGGTPLAVAKDARVLCVVRRTSSRAAFASASASCAAWAFAP
jgi:potassium-transporting ATPase ATP-binding subunit